MNTTDNNELLNFKGNNYTVKNGVLTWEYGKLNLSKHFTVIPNGVLEIGKQDNEEMPTNMFMYHASEAITNIYLPDTVRTIQDYGFYGFNHLSNIRLSDNLEKIGKDAFRNCVNLDTIVIPNTVKHIEFRAFENCKSLRRVILKDGLEEIELATFKDCENLETITIPKTVWKIGLNAFNGCSSLKNVTLVDGLKIIDTSAFGECEKLESITIPKTVKCIEMYAFHGCTYLKKVTLLNGLKEISKAAFKNCYSLEEIIIPSSVIKINYRAFENCTNLRRITIRYKNYNELKELFSESNQLDFNNINIESLIFEGPELTKEQKDTLQRLFDNKGVGIIFKINNNIELTEQEEIEAYEKEINAKKYPDDIQILLDQINNICNSLSDEDKNNYLDKVNLLLENYDKESEKLKPKFRRKKEIKLEKTPSKDIKTLKQELLKNLEIIVLDLSKEITVIDQQDILNKNREKLIQIEMILDSLNVLGEKYSDGEELKDITESIKYIISNISDDRYRKVLEENLNRIIEKYTTIINNIINNKVLLENTDIKEIETDLREELQILLQIINNYEEENSKMNKDNISKQLTESKNIVNSEETEELSKKDEHKPIINYVTELTNRINTNELIGIDDKDKMKKDLLEKIFLSEELLKEKDINSPKEYYQFIQEVFNNLMEIELTIEDYLKKVEEFNKYSR